MAKESIKGRSRDDASVFSYIERYKQRIETMPPGICPLNFQLSLLEAGALQTCGKCVPCRDGLPQLAKMLRRVVECDPALDESYLEEMRTLAQMICDFSDCAIGYEAAQVFLEGMDSFADEYAAHIKTKRCQAGVGQSVPCETLCPAHVDVPSYITYVTQGKYADAVNTVRKDNPFPTACAYVCEHPCEERCRRGLIDAPINIRGIKKFAVDNAPADSIPCPPRNPATGKRIAIVGSGPAGMTCAYFSALMGHEVDVFEQRKRLGGMLRYGIPAYRFPRAKLDEDIQGILNVGGIQVHTEHTVDMEEIKRLHDEYDAVFIGIGAQKGKQLRIDGADATGVLSAVDFLGQLGDEIYPDLSNKRVIVIGGGNVAMDCARTAIRLNPESVSVVYRRRKEDMTALPIEVEGAIAEGVEMRMLQSPVSIETDEEGKVKALITQPQMISNVKGGRPAPKDAKKEQERIEADVILVAIGQDIHSKPFEEYGLVADRGCFKVDDFLLSEGQEKLYSGGDCQTGPLTVIKAVAAGKVAARNIDEYLGYHHKIDYLVDVPSPRLNDRTPKGRVEIEEQLPSIRRRNFDAVEFGMSREEVLQECGRCLRCDHYGAGSMEGGRQRYA